jgi:hypothetical protein
MTEEEVLAIHRIGPKRLEAIREHGLHPLEEDVVYKCPRKADARFYAAWQSVLQPPKRATRSPGRRLRAVDLELDPDAVEPTPRARQWMSTRV